MTSGNGPKDQRTDEARGELTAARPMKDCGKERCRALIDAYGADPSRWPSLERQAAEAWLVQAKSAEGEEAWLNEAAELDALLDAAPPVQPSAMLLRRVAEIPLRMGAPARREGIGLVLWRWVALAAGAAVLGLAAGLTVPDRLAVSSVSDGGSVSDRTSAYVGASAPEGEAGWDELADLALAGEFDEEPWP